MGKLRGARSRFAGPLSRVAGRASRHRSRKLYPAQPYAAYASCERIRWAALAGVGASVFTGDSTSANREALRNGARCRRASPRRQPQPSAIRCMLVLSQAPGGSQLLRSGVRRTAGGTAGAAGEREVALVISVRLGIAGTGKQTLATMSQAAHTEHTSPPPVRVNTEVVGERKTSPTPTIDERRELIRRTAASRASRHRCRCVHMTCFSRRPPSLWCCRQETRERVARRRSPTQGFIGFRACRSHEEPSPAALICSFRPSSLVPSCRLRQSQEQWRERGTSCRAAQALLESVRVTTRRPTRPRFTGSVLLCRRKELRPRVPGPNASAHPCDLLDPPWGNPPPRPVQWPRARWAPGPRLCAVRALHSIYSTSVLALASVCPNSGTHVSRAQCLQLLQPACSAGAAAAFLKDKKGPGVSSVESDEICPARPLGLPLAGTALDVGDLGIKVGVQNRPAGGPSCLLPQPQLSLSFTSHDSSSS